jgi:hypothetical protein
MYAIRTSENYTVWAPTPLVNYSKRVKFPSLFFAATLNTENTRGKNIPQVLPFKFSSLKLFSEREKRHFNISTRLLKHEKSWEEKKGDEGELLDSGFSIFVYSHT